MIDSEVPNLIEKEGQFQESSLDLTASNNYASKAVLGALGSILNNKYSEGYPGARYYGGQANIDQIEEIAKKRALKIFGLSEDSWHGNVQSYSGSTANLAIYSAFLKPGDKILAMKLDQGGHITHGLPASFPGKIYQFSFYGVDKETEIIDYDELESIAIQEKPKMIICGATAYSRIINFEKFSEIAKKVGAYLLADISHIAGLIVGGVHPSPFPYADFVMTTTHKTLRGPRGAIIICKKEYAEAIDRAVFPGLQGGPHDHQIAAKAICFYEALQPEFIKYSEQIVKNAKKLSQELQKYGFRIVSGGTDNHLMLLDLKSAKISGKDAQIKLEEAGIIVNKNTIPFDPQSVSICSGIRLGTPAVTTRGMKEEEMTIIAKLISDVLLIGKSVNQEVIYLTKKFTIS